MTAFEIQVHQSIQEIEPALWDNLASGRGFQSHRWYSFGERAMADCPAVYLIAREKNNPIAAAVLYQVRNEPLPLPKLLRIFFDSYFRHKPLLICRSPLADASGLLLPETPIHHHILSTLADAARTELERRHCSFLLLDFLPTSLLQPKVADFVPLTLADPGTALMLTHGSFEAYLAADKKTRNDYHHTNRKADEMGFRLSRFTRVDDIDSALELIRRISQKHNSPPNPWTRGLLENLEMIDATWFEVRQNSRLVGCIVTMRDNGTQIATALGLANDVPFAYFMLIYAAIKEAFDQRVKIFRLGSGAYEVKRRLGFQIEDTNHILVSGSGHLSRILMRLVSR